MKLKQIFNTTILTIGLLLAGYSYLKSQNKLSLDFASTTKSIDSKPWLIKDNSSIYDGDTLRVVRGSEELKIRFCGIDAPERDQKLGIESRDYLRSLVAQGDGTIYVLPIEKDRYGRTVAELWIPIKPDYEREIHLNTAMVEAGMAWHYEKYSGNCESAENLVWAEKIAREDKLGIWASNSQPPWEFRASKKANK
ncbi:nuclease (SNase domain-containing protein) (plasmid) [Stanieria cyanosphaera PCC 7437]|jgi:endonuclease YncB( thermonuclease family)|uniref:Nuclease (SNase domain-containing protein) n=1 Tax=Stanieria cyanosphaera (strain ATCC 29371 / PCC 7437) TaxID=111780 RepID=K9Y2U6_STAC7|nr:thermonuclease family protein [Stanieria cyanosphaera]AFZ38362.1 nuclease (SNase domain-containing protein) [Stanieria cyanosphaera PCC 7437]